MSISSKILFAIGGYWLLSKFGGAAYEQIQWEIQPVRLKDLHPFQGTFDLRIKLKNNLPADITLKQYTGEVKVNNNLIATIDSQENIVLPKGQEIIVAAAAKVKAAGFFQNLVSLKDQPIEVVSYLKTSVVDIPISNKIYLFYYVE